MEDNQEVPEEKEESSLSRGKYLGAAAALVAMYT